jgi:hypothetical protein
VNFVYSGIQDFPYEIANRTVFCFEAIGQLFAAVGDDLPCRGMGNR